MDTSSTTRIEAQKFYVYTDGSCDYTDRMGGSAAVVKHPTTGDLLCRGACESGASVRRAELRALLLGLSLVSDLSGLSGAKFRDNFISGGWPRMEVFWYTDRQDLAGAVTAPGGGKLFSRESDADLWSTVAWYETVMHITAHLVPRNTVPEQKEMDRVCGLLRKSMQACAFDTRWVHNLELL